MCIQNGRKNSEKKKETYYYDSSNHNNEFQVAHNARVLKLMERIKESSTEGYDSRTAGFSHHCRHSAEWGVKHIQIVD